MNYRGYIKHIIILIAASFYFHGAAHGQITAGGDAYADSVTARYQTSCGAYRLDVTLVGEKERNSSISISLNGKDISGRSDLAGLRAFVQNVRNPYVSTFMCYKEDVSFVVNGRPRSGNNTTYEQVLPLRA